jgi:hypothetical protein
MVMFGELRRWDYEKGKWVDDEKSQSELIQIIEDTSKVYVVRSKAELI